MTYTTTRYDAVSSAVTECPNCGETDRLSGHPVDSAIDLTCEACGHAWQRDTQRRCRSCGSDNLRYTPRPLWERGRGEQRTPAGRIDAYACYDCGEADAVASIGGRS